MANKFLFSSSNSQLTPANTRNEAGGPAYKFAPKHALAQIAATGCFNGVFYASAESQLEQMLTLVDQIDDDLFLAKLAVYARERAFMKDMPMALLLVLSKRNTELMHRVFDRVVDNGRVLRTLFQMVRSGQFGRKSLSSSLQRAFQRWLNEASVSKLLSASIGNNPSLRDVLRMARPTPPDNARRALFGWLTGKDVAQWAPATEADLPADVQQLIAYRNAETEAEQVQILDKLSVRWDLLADAAHGPDVWKAIAKQMGPQALRMNLNTLMRHGVLGANAPNTGATVGSLIADALGWKVESESETDDMVNYVAERLADEEEVRRSRQFPYQFMAAYLNAGNNLPHAIKKALHRAASVACGNVPQLPGPIVIGLDVSGSMLSPVTGDRGYGATSKVTCVDAAALFAAAILRRNPDSVVIPFDTRAYDVRIDPSDSILSLSERLAKYGGGGTDCSIPLQHANAKYRDRTFAGAVLVSDNQSWVYNSFPYAYGNYGSSGVLTAWQQFVANQKLRGVTSPKLVCIDIQPYTTSQAPEREDILNVGGFSDAVFSVISSFLSENPQRFVSEVEAMVI